MTPSENIEISSATPAEMRAVATLLREADLPSEDLAAEAAHFLVARRGGAVVGAVGAEVFGADALLRSLVVASVVRGAGLGGRLVDELERRAGVRGVRRWWLLTTTAERFFIARGFRVAARAEAPEAIRQTGQFCGGCCGSAVGLTWERAGGAP